MNNFNNFNNIMHNYHDNKESFFIYVEYKNAKWIVDYIESDGLIIPKSALKISTSEDDTICVNYGIDYGVDYCNAGENTDYFPYDDCYIATTNAIENSIEKVVQNK